MDLKEKIRLLTTGDSSLSARKSDELLLNKPSAEDLRKIEEGGFVQESFFKTVSGAVTQAKSKKKKKKNKQQQQQQQQQGGLANDTLNSSSLFSTSTTLASLPSTKEILLMNTDTSNEPLFGALFTEPEDVRKQHWIEKLVNIRSRLA